MKTRHCQATHQGYRRQANEDRLLAAEACGLYAACDGMGGHEAGDVAAELGVQRMQDAYAALRSGGTPPSVPDALSAAVDEANKAVIALGRRPEFEGSRRKPGATVAALALDLEQGDAWVTHLGDSRVYRYRRSEEPPLRRLTKDHTVAGHAIYTALYDESALGQVKPQRVGARVGDVFLICTDGLTDVVGDAELSWILSRERFDALADHMVAAALAAGGPDNVTVLAVEVIE